MLPLRSGRSGKHGVSALFFIAGMVAIALFPAEAQQKPAKKDPKPKTPDAAAALGSNIPLPIGHEIKGLVLPDIDLQGHLRTRFEATTAKRIDAERIQFMGLKMTSFTPENAIDLQLDLPESTFDLNTRILRSQRRTSIARSDFTIEGDAMEFNTIDRKGTLTGNVRMIIKDHSELAGKKNTP
jgi:hypothetical protein